MNKAEKPEFEKIALEIIRKTFGIPSDYKESDLQTDIIQALETTYTAGRKAQKEVDAKIAEDYFFGSVARMQAYKDEIAKAIRNQGDLK
jgi:hypothetical protein